MPYRHRAELAHLKAAFNAAGAVPGVVHNRGPGYWVRALRSATGMTQELLSARSGVPRAQISRIETGRADPKLSTLQRLFRAAWVDMVFLPRTPGGYDRYLRDCGYRGRSGGAPAEQKRLAKLIRQARARQGYIRKTG